jgi:hypothetical protein
MRRREIKEIGDLSRGWHIRNIADISKLGDILMSHKKCVNMGVCCFKMT